MASAQAKRSPRFRLASAQGKGAHRVEADRPVFEEIRLAVDAIEIGSQREACSAPYCRVGFASSSWPRVRAHREMCHCTAGYLVKGVRFGLGQTNSDQGRWVDNKPQEGRAFP
jgi:hypothetical protein